MVEENFKTLLQISEALTNERISKALSERFKEPMIFTHWEYVGETGKGDSYLSEVIRIRIYGNANGITKHVQVILKSIPKNLCRRLTYRSDEFFKNEINFYQHVLPALLEFEASKSVSEPCENFTKLFFAYSDGVNDVICLEDAGLENFVSAVRQDGIDYEHCKIILKTLAKYHSLSFAMRDQQPDDFDRLSDYIFETYYDPRLWNWYRKFFKRICGIAIDAVEKEYPNTIYVEKIKEFAVPEDRYKDMIRATRDRTNCVISHGDSWTNNFLFKYNNNVPVATKIIDFQISRCASPVLDVCFVFSACTEQELRTKYYDKLIDYYYEVLSQRITELGSDPNRLYSYDTYMMELKKYSYFGLLFSFESTPMIILPPEDAINMEMAGDQKRDIDDFWTLPPFKTKEGRLREANNVVHCVDKGFI
ncbi:uncharacterized protein LOC116773618 [Danaus plexippus]|uniref:Juvenile hormone-inducible protein n=1 Tax=Danaus plexippus plexippus TaxID=278856 RepID=A0A212EPF3_DANPL|nr:uncharacterized protein LOC116773618 [Danaus plexippus]XP_032521994.1 uncharacterized protein LOC116773618 [Danaus plexippus]OWR43359.1 putative Juvenile hormone-inducible protein [Danaus plexippus plexippus]